MTYSQAQPNANPYLKSEAETSAPPVAKPRGITIRANALRAQAAYASPTPAEASLQMSAPACQTVKATSPTPTQSAPKIEVQRPLAAASTMKEVDCDDEESVSRPVITPELLQLAARYVEIFKGPMPPAEREKAIAEVAKFYSGADRISRLEALVSSF